MGDQPTPPHAQTMSDILSQYNSYIPSILNTTTGTEASLMAPSGPGTTAAREAAGINAQLNPSYALANKVNNAINLNGLSPGEQNAVERGLNQTKSGTGNLGLINPTNIVSDAMNFGGAFNNKVGIASNATGNTAGAMNTFNPTAVATGQPTQTFGSNLLGTMGGVNNAFTAGQTSVANANSIPQYLNGVCCFIFLEAYHGRLPKCVRRGRDGYYQCNYDIAVGYRRMASWLVPLMKENNFIRGVVWNLMVDPITQHLNHPKKGWRKTLTHSWLKFWSWYGRGHWEVEYYKPWNYYATI